MKELRKTERGMRNEVSDGETAECGNGGRQRVWRTLFTFLACGMLLSIASCSKQKTPPPRVVPVITVAAERKDVPLQIKAIGNVEASNTVQVKAQVNGEISEVFFREGQDVQKGDRLFRIDPRPFEAALRQAESALARDTAQAANAAEDAKRYAELATRGFVSRQEYDRARTNSEALDAVVNADEAAAENARLQLAYTAINAPIGGRTGSIQIKKGNVVKANDLALVTINQISPINVSFSVPEQELPAVKRYQASGELAVEARIPQNGEHTSRGTLTFIDNAVNTTTGTILLKATFPNSDHLLWPGQFVDVVLTLAVEKGRTVVPSQAVQTGQQGQYVFVIKDDRTAEMRPVAPVRMYEDSTVLEGGVKPGELVVTDGQLRLTPGAKVEIKNDIEKQASAPTGTGSTTDTKVDKEGKKSKP